MFKLFFSSLVFLLSTLIPPLAQGQSCEDRAQSAADRAYNSVLSDCTGQLECRSDRDCQSGEECKNGSCVDIPACRDLPGNTTCGQWVPTTTVCRIDPDYICNGTCTRGRLWQVDERTCSFTNGCGMLVERYQDSRTFATISGCNL